jgi:SAM-dependent methyltransferase
VREQPAQEAGAANAPCQNGDLHGSILSVTSSTDLAAMARRWSDALETWAIPSDIRASATRDPWVLPVARFAGRADRAAVTRDGVSFERAREVLEGAPGSVLDVGAGAGAASLPLAEWATSITAVDSNADMLTAFAERADAIGVPHREVVGRWPDVAADAASAIASDSGVHDVAVVHHVVYNVPDIVPFLAALDARTSRRVVIELPPHHPLSWMNPLWKRFHDLDRPSTPIAGDVVEILGAMEVRDLLVEHWVMDDAAAADGSDHETLEQRAAIVAQRLCLPETREPEVAAALADIDPGHHRDAVTISWSPPG